MELIGPGCDDRHEIELDLERLARRLIDTDPDAILKLELLLARLKRGFISLEIIQDYIDK